jgi:hypothetical protein
VPYFNSDAVKRAEYDSQTMRLTIWFPNGPYDFCGVPQYVWDGLLSASSKGTYYSDHIRDRYHC